MKILESAFKSPLLDIKKKDRKAIKHLLNGLEVEATKALLENQELPEFDLCTVTVPGTNLFCHGNKGFPRSVMPQLKGFPVAGSPAASMKTAKSGKVDCSQEFLIMLADTKIKTKRYSIDPTKLKASQNQLVGAKIALRLGEMKNNPEHKKFTMPYFVSSDGYILDGHHGWASVLCYSLIHKKSVKINVIEVNLKIKQLIKLAVTFTKEFGIAPKDASAAN